MFKTPSTWLKKLSAMALIAALLIPAVEPALAVAPAPDVTQLTANPLSFNPSIGEKTRLWYYLSTGADAAYVLIKDSQNRGIVTLTGTANPAWNYVDWNGCPLGQCPLPAGQYFYSVTAVRAGAVNTANATSPITIVTQVPAPVITILSATSPIDITKGDQSTISYNLSNSTGTVTSVSITIASGANTVTIPGSTAIGLNHVDWDAKIGNAKAPAGSYNFTISATNSVFGTATVNSSSPIIVIYSAPAVPVVTVLSSSTTSFNPFAANPQSASLQYSLDSAAQSVYLEIRDSSQNLVQSLIGSTAVSGNVIQWNGQGSNVYNGGQIVNPGSYSYTLRAVRTGLTGYAYGTFTVTGTPPVTTPVVTILGSTTIQFNPSSQSAQIYYSLDHPVDTVSVKIMLGSNLVNQWSAPASLNNLTTWDGRGSFLYNNNQLVAPGVYTFTISATKAGLTGTASGIITAIANPVNTVPVVSGLSANPNTFNPGAGEKTTLSYNLDRAVDGVSIDILNGGTLVRTLSAPTQMNSNSVLWDGLKTDGTVANPGTYTFTVRATKAGLTGVAYSQNFNSTINVTTGGVVAPVITLTSVTSQFNPYNGESATISYTLDKAVSSVIVTILNGSNPIVLSGPTSAGVVNSVTWNGRDSLYNSIVATGLYNFTIKATLANGVSSTLYSTSPINVVSGTSGCMAHITNLTTNNTSFNPSNGESVTVSYYVDRSATISAKIFDQNNNQIRTLYSTTSPYYASTSGTYSLTWDGRNDGNVVVANGVYTYQLTANASYYTGTTCSTDVQSGSVLVTYTSTNSKPVLSNIYVSPDPFNPDLQSTNIYFQLDKQAQITLEILDLNNNVLRHLMDNVTQGAGSHFMTWDGKDNFVASLANGTYKIRIQATNSYGTDTQYTTLRIDHSAVINNTGNLIQNLTIVPDIFNPKLGQTSTAYYNLPKNATVTVEILDPGSNVVRTLVDHVYRSNSVYNYSTAYGSFNFADVWDGKYSYGTYAPDNVFRFRITATTSSGESEVQTAYVEVDTDGRIIGFPTTADCAGFKDVSMNSPYCKAIDLMKDNGIFNGYADNTFRPYHQINRAEATKVVLLALNIPVSDIVYNLGFWDIDPNAWYGPYLRIAKRLGIIRGYPDNTFRPDQTLNRVELLKIFLESTGITMPYCNSVAFGDTPINSDTRWYTDYVCYAKNNSLMHDDGSGRFNPATPMTRGDVADLFFQYELRGLSTQTRARTGY